MSSEATLEPHAELVLLSAGDEAVHPFMKKALVRRHGVEGVLVFIDGDIIVTGPLEGPLSQARARKVFAFG